MVISIREFSTGLLVTTYCWKVVIEGIKVASGTNKTNIHYASYEYLEVKGVDFFAYFTFVTQLFCTVSQRKQYRNFSLH